MNPMEGIPNAAASRRGITGQCPAYEEATGHGMRFFLQAPRTVAPVAHWCSEDQTLREPEQCLRVPEVAVGKTRATRSWVQAAAQP